MYAQQDKQEGMTAFRVAEKKYQLHKDQQLRKRQVDKHAWIQTLQCMQRAVHCSLELHADQVEIDWSVIIIYVIHQVNSVKWYAMVDTQVQG